MDEEENVLDNIPENDEYKGTDEIIDETSKQNIEEIKSQSAEPAIEQNEKESELIKHGEESETVQQERDDEIVHDELKTEQHEELEMVTEEKCELEPADLFEDFIHKGTLDYGSDDEDMESKKRQSVNFVIEGVIINEDMEDEETFTIVSVEEEKEEEEEGEGSINEDEEEQKIRKSSIYTKERSSFNYDMAPRIRDIEDTQALDGDFLIAQEYIMPLKFYKYMDKKIEEESEVESISEEEEVFIDRAPYYEKHEFLTNQVKYEKIKNNVLQRKIAKFFKRRKMGHVLKEPDQQFDTQDKYKKKLDAYGELYNLDYTQRTTVTNELEGLKSETNSKFLVLIKLFKDLQAQEKDTGYGLIYSKTGKPILDKLVETLVNRQKNLMQTVGDMRLKHLQLKNMVLEKQNEIASLDKIGENLYLMDYEQLKVENRSYMDKMEERDDELSGLRSKCQKTIQMLAHRREKSASLESDIYDLTDELQHHTDNSLAVRGNLNVLKQQRDYYRIMTNKLRDESGLLTQNDLLRDMEYSVDELKSLSVELEWLKEEHKIKAQQIRNIRKNIELTPQTLIKRSQKETGSRNTHERHLYKCRPSLHKPVLPSDAFKYLRNYRDKPTYDKYEKKSKNKTTFICTK